MGRKILAVIVALIIATAIIMIVEMLNSYILPPPPADVMKDTARLREYMANGPAMAYAVVLIGYALGAFVGGFIVTKISRLVSSGLTLPIVFGAVLTLLGISNMVMIPGQPIWFMIVALIIFIPAAIVGSKFARS
jgi:hypothetical protein